MTVPSVLNVTQAAQLSGDATTFAVTIPSSTAGSTFVIFYESGNNSATITSITGGSGTWSQKQNNVATASAWGVLSGVSAGTTTLTFNLSTADSPVVAIYEVANTSGVVDQNATIKDSTSVTTITSNTITTANAEDIVIGTIIGWPDSGTLPTVTITSSGYTNQSLIANSTTGNSMIKTGYRLESATGTFGYNATTSNATTSATYVVSLQGTSSGASTNFGDGFSDVL